MRENLENGLIKFWRDILDLEAFESLTPNLQVDLLEELQSDDEFGRRWELFKFLGDLVRGLDLDDPSPFIDAAIGKVETASKLCVRRAEELAEPLREVHVIDADYVNEDIESDDIEEIVSAIRSGTDVYTALHSKASDLVEFSLEWKPSGDDWTENSTSIQVELAGRVIAHLLESQAVSA